MDARFNRPPVTRRRKVVLSLAAVLALLSPFGFGLWRGDQDRHCWTWDGREPEFYRYDVPGCDGPGFWD